jgi:hypothetical protein
MKLEKFCVCTHIDCEAREAHGLAIRASPYTSYNF